MQLELAISSRSVRHLLLAIALCAVLASCAARPLAEWHDSSFSGAVDNVMIIGVSEQPIVRRLFEDTFVKELAALKVTATPSYRTLTDEQILSRDQLDAAIEAQSLDAVLVTRVIGVEEIDVYRPPEYTVYYQNYHSYFRHAYEVATPGYSESYEILKLESNLYDTASQQMIWSMQSESFDPYSAQQLIEEQISLAIKSLRDAGLISTP